MSPDAYLPRKNRYDAFPWQVQGFRAGVWCVISCHISEARAVKGLPDTQVPAWFTAFVPQGVLRSRRIYLGRSIQPTIPPSIMIITPTRRVPLLRTNPLVERSSVRLSSFTPFVKLWKKTLITLASLMMPVLAKVFGAGCRSRVRRSENYDVRR